MGVPDPSSDAPASAPRPLDARGRLVVAATLVAFATLLGGGTAIALSSDPADAHPVAAATTVSRIASGQAGTATERAIATPRPASDASARVRPARGTALALLATLPVRGKSPLTGYERTADFGSAWLDVDRNGCDTRNDVLRRDLEVTSAPGCRVLRGVLRDPYTGATIRFVRGEGTSTAVQIDHVVALANAWRTGAQRLTQAQRIDLANDPINLFAVDGPTNEQKRDGDAATWLPPMKAFRCTYVAHQVAVKAAYGLWVTPAEHAAMQRVLTGCPAERAPVSTVSHVVPPTSAGPGVPRPSPRPTASSATPSTAPPAGASAICRDGSASFSTRRSGTCSRHGGVARWL